MKPKQSQINRWPESDLIRRLCHALDIASLTIEHLAPAGYTDPHNPAASVRPEKPIAETAVLLYAAMAAAHHPEVDARLHRVARQLAPHARSAQLQLGLALNPGLALDYSLAHIVLGRLGYPDPAFDALLTQCRAAQASAGRERLPHRVLEQQWIESITGLSQTSAPILRHIQRRDIERTARLSILNRPMDVLSATDDDLYAFTHALMYVTGFELSSVALPRTRVVLLAEAEAALAHCLDAQDYDLAGELLLSWPLTGRSWSPTAAFAFRVLAEVEDQAGFLPTPATRISELDARTGASRKQYLLATAYHTAYVMGLVCAAALQPGCAPPTTVSTRCATLGSAAQLLPLLDDCRPIPHWLESFRRLDPLEADALAPLLFNIALHRHAAQHDFAALHQLLRLGHTLHLTDIPAASQAAELLERMTLYANTLHPEAQPQEGTQPTPGPSHPDILHSALLNTTASTQFPTLP
ncbi:MAG TPA: hypothetical protein VK627_01365 [Edaphobacter sp.]|nr:hypothetical protein [Edaphobacter sp.]